MVTDRSVSFKGGRRTGRKCFLAFAILSLLVGPAAQGEIIFQHDFEGIAGEGEFPQTWGSQFGATDFLTLNPADSGFSTAWLDPVPAELGTSFGVAGFGSSAAADTGVALEAATQYTLSFTQFRRDDRLGESVRASLFVQSDAFGFATAPFADVTFDAVTTQDTFVERTLTFATLASDAAFADELALFGGTLRLRFDDGDLTNDGDGFQSGIDNIQLTAAAVPEPSSIAALIGLVGIGAWRRRRAQK